MYFITNQGNFTIYRGATHLGNGTTGITFRGGDPMTDHMHFHIVDSPSTTSATTYQLYFRCQSGASFPTKINSPYTENSISTITALEIKG